MRMGSHNPVRRIYRDIHAVARLASWPHVFQSNQATGTGKTYQALMTSMLALREAQAAGESLIVVYVAPQHSHIDIHNHAPMQKVGSPQALLGESPAIPCVKVASRTQLTDPEEAHNLYRDLCYYEARLEQRHGGKAAPSLVRCLQQLLYEHQGRRKKPLPEDAIAQKMGAIKRNQATLEGLRRAKYSEDELKGSRDKLTEHHDELFGYMAGAVKIVLQQSTRDGKTLDGVLGCPALAEPLRFFQRQLLPWYEVVRRPGGPLGLVAMTASRLMTQQAFPLPRRDGAALGKGDFSVQNGYLEEAVHGLGVGAGVYGLSEGRTRFLFLLDESDEVKAVLDSPAPAGENAKRMYLRGMLLNQARATQIGNVLLNEMPLLFSSAAQQSEVVESYAALFAAHADLARWGEVKTAAEQAQLPRLSAAAQTALRRHQRRLRLGTMSPAHHLQQIRLRHKVLDLLDHQYQNHPIINGTRDDKLAQFCRLLTAFCQGVSWVNLNLDDPAVAAAGSTGTFTAGSWSFINLEDQRLDGLLAHRDTADVNDVQIISEPFLRDSGGEVGATTFSLSDTFELMLTLTGIVHAMVNTGDDTPAFALLSDAYRGDNHTSSAPLSEMIESLAHVRVKDLMAVRREVSPQADIDDNLAFRRPHLIMQWVPDFAYRFMPGEPGFSVVPAIGYRAWSAEHHLERLASPHACAVNWPLAQPTINAQDAAARPAHSLVLISATGGFDATHLGGFSGDMLAHSPHVTYVPMSEHALGLARQARELRQRGEGNTPGRPLPAIGQIPEHEGILGEDAKGPLLAQIDDVLETLTHNPYKRKESRRVVDLITLLGKRSGSLKASHAVSSGVYKAVSQVLYENAAPRMALMLIQSLKTPVAAFKKLTGKRFVEIIDGHLYGYWEGQKGRGGRPVLVVAYRSGRKEGTDARINQMLQGQGAYGDRRGALERFLCDAGLTIDVERHFPGENAAGEPQTYGATDLLRRELGCHGVIVAAFQSAGLGLNFKVDTHLGREHERDMDMLVLGMSPHFTRARPRFEHYQGPPGEAEPVETDTRRDARAGQNARAFQSNNAIIHGAAMTGIELAARLNQGRWGGDATRPSRLYRAEDIRLHPDSYLPAFRDFLQEQHTLDLARAVFQAVGRGERTSSSQRQTLLVCEEIITHLLAADPVLYGLDGKGHSRASQLHSASLNSFALMQYVRRYRRRVYDYPDPTAVSAVEARLFDAEDAFTDNPAIDGWKNRQLRAIRQMNQGKLSAPEAAALIRRWEAWRHPSLLFEPTREAYRQQALEAGVAEDVLALMWWPLPRWRFLPLRRDSRGGWSISLIAPDDAEADASVAYPGEALERGYQLPAGMLKLMQRRGLAQEKWRTPALRQKTQNTVLHPILLADFKGIWGELALDGWLAQLSGELEGLARLPGSEMVGIYEFFDRYLRWTAPGGEAVLVALDAKYHARATDMRYAAAVQDDAQGKQAAVRRWAADKGYQRVVMAYINTRPRPQEEARSGLQQDDVISLSAFVRISPSDVNAPYDTPLNDNATAQCQPMESPLLAVNQAGVTRWIQAVTGETR